MAEFCLTPYKRKFVENWLREVTRYYKEGTICRSVLSIIQQDEESADVNEQAVDKHVRLPKDIHGNSKLTEYNVMNSVQTLPSVTLSYIKVTEKQPKQDFPDIGDKTSTKEFNNENRRKEEKRPLIIVDPQMITPSGTLPATNRKLVNNFEKEVQQIHHQRNRVARESSFTSRKSNSREIYANCKVQSTDKNSFVISRSNMRYQVWRNHSFLDLPLRFRNDIQSSLTKTPKIVQKDIKTNSNNNIKNADQTGTTRRLDNQTLMTTTVWAW